MRGRRPRRRFWFELSLAVTSVLLVMAAASNPRWVESLLGVDPDAGSGALEWLMPVLVAAVAVGSSLLAFIELRRTLAAPAR
jgi:hypothetical protein